MKEMNDSNLINANSPKKSTPLPVAIHVTYIQYRIIHILYATWKTVWRRYSPKSRTFNMSKVFSVHSFDVAEQYLNRLSSWRRMLDDHVWNNLLYHTEEETRKNLQMSKGGSKQAIASDASKRLLMPPPLPSGKHPRAWEYLIQPTQQEIMSSDMILKLNETKILNEFRTIFIEAMIKNSIYDDDELEFLLEELIIVDRSSRLAKIEHEHVVYPSKLIRESIKKHFRISAYNDHMNMKKESDQSRNNRIHAIVQKHKKQLAARLSMNANASDISFRMLTQ